MELKDKCAHLDSLNIRKKTLEVELKSVNEEIEALNEELVLLWQENDMTSVNYEGLGTFYINKSVRARCVNDEMFFQYLRDNNQDAIIKEQINPQTLSAWAKESGLPKEHLERLGLHVYEEFKVKQRRS